jgi:hypothetical protein
MVEYSEWIEAVHEAYKTEGGTYDEGTASQLVQIAAEFWQRNKEELKQIGYREAVRLARRSINL